MVASRTASTFSRFLCAVLAVLHLMVFTTAQAGTLPSTTAGGLNVYLQAMVAGNANITRNNMGSTVLSLPAGQTSEQTFDLFRGTGMIWARWYRLEAAGTIQVVRAIRTPQVNSAGGHIQLVIVNYDPETASKPYIANANGGIVNYYGGVDPFEPFKGGNGIWNKVSRSEFYTAVGQASMQYSVPTAYVAVALQRDVMRLWDECTVKVFGACLRRVYHQELKSYVKPTWSVGVSHDSGRMTKYATAFIVRGCTGAPESCVAQSGMTFMDASVNSDFPSTEALMSTIEHQQAAWTGLAFALLFAAISVIAAPLLMDAPGLFSAAVNSVATDSIGSGLAAYTTEVLGYSLVSVVASNGGGGLTDGQNGFLGRLGSIPVAGSFNPTQVSPEWDMRPAVTASFLQQPLESTAGGIGEMYNAKPAETSDKPTNDFFEMREIAPEKTGGLPSLH